MFQCSPEAGPFTLPVDTIQGMFGGTIAAVSLPASFAPHPCLFASLAHETGGHDVLHADPGLLGELKEKVAQKFPDYGELWAYWMDETAADVYGLLNYGPSYTYCMAFAFSAINTAYGSKELLHLDSYSSYGTLDVHPTDVLRLGLAIGALNSMTLSPVRCKPRFSHALRGM